MKISTLLIVSIISTCCVFQACNTVEEQGEGDHPEAVWYDTAYHKNGKIEWIRGFKDSVTHGLYCGYDTNSVLKVQGFDKNGRGAGWHIYWDENSRRSAIIYYNPERACVIGIPEVNKKVHDSYYIHPLYNNLYVDTQFLKKGIPLDKIFEASKVKNFMSNSKLNESKHFSETVLRKKGVWRFNAKNGDAVSIFSIKNLVW